MQDPVVLGGVLVGLFSAPFLTYLVIAWLARSDIDGRKPRAERTAPATQAPPSRTIPGGNGPRED